MRIIIMFGEEERMFKKLFPPKHWYGGYSNWENKICHLLDLIEKEKKE